MAKNCKETYEPTDTERALADIIEFGEFNETGGTLGRKDWPIG